MTKLENMLQYVSEHNEFYKNRIKEFGIKNPLDITQWPILTRKELQENRYNMFSEGYKTKYYNQQLHRQSSSGSSGVPVNVYWEYKDWYASNMSLWRKRFEWYGITPNDKYVVFTLNAFDMEIKCTKSLHSSVLYNILSINMSLVHTEEQYVEIIKVINDFKPKWLFVQPFVLNRLIEVYDKYRIQRPKSIVYIESVGEVLTLNLRRRVRSFFGIPFANMYGSEEMNGIAYECPSNTMLVLKDNVFLEVKNETGISNSGEGEVIITNLNNHAMPLIRYAQGDQAAVETLKTNNKYNESSIISFIKGRSVESIKLEHNVEINAFMLSEIISEVNNQFDDIIKCYKFIYGLKETILQCYVEIDASRESWFGSVQKCIQNIFNNKVLKRIELHVIAVSKRGFSPSVKTKILEIKETLV